MRQICFQTILEEDFVRNRRIRQAVLPGETKLLFDKQVIDAY